MSHVRAIGPESSPKPRRHVGEKRLIGESGLGLFAGPINQLQRVR